METTANHTPKSLKRAWTCCQDLFSASTFSEACSSFQAMLESLPLWAWLLLPVMALVVVINGHALVLPLAAGAFLVAVYATVRKAVSDAMRAERHDPTIR